MKFSRRRVRKWLSRQILVSVYSENTTTGFHFSEVSSLVPSWRYLVIKGHGRGEAPFTVHRSTMSTPSNHWIGGEWQRRGRFRTYLESNPDHLTPGRFTDSHSEQFSIRKIYLQIVNETRRATVDSWFIDWLNCYL